MQAVQASIPDAAWITPYLVSERFNMSFHVVKVTFSARCTPVEASQRLPAGRTDRGLSIFTGTCSRRVIDFAAELLFSVPETTKLSGTNDYVSYTADKVPLNGTLITPNM